MIEEIDSPKLRLVTAEEAAFTYCNGLDSNDFIGRPAADKIVLEPSDKYLVIDAGGMTYSVELWHNDKLFSNHH